MPEPAGRNETERRSRRETPAPAPPSTGPGWRVDPGPDGRGAPKPPRQGFPRLGYRVLGIIAVFLVLNAVIASLLPSGEERLRIPYSPTFLRQVDAGNVAKFTSTGEAVQGEFKKPVTYPPPAEGSEEKGKTASRFETQLPAFVDGARLESTLREKGVILNAEPLEEGRGLLATVLLYFGPTLLFIGLLVYFMRRATSGGGMTGSFGRSKARRYEDGGTQRVSFDDVAGIEEAEAELTEIVDFLKNPDRYRKLGGRIPRGALLSGQPGTGKTLLARAVAGEAGVPFFSMSASEFIEMIVGVGASRVRDLFAQAKAAAPAIIFIDELDAIGRSRSALRRLRRRARRARADAEPDPDRDGRIRRLDGRDRAGIDEPAGRAGLRPAPAGPVRPPDRSAGARPRRQEGDPRGAHALGAARG